MSESIVRTTHRQQPVPPAGKTVPSEQETSDTPKQLAKRGRPSGLSKAERARRKREQAERYAAQAELLERAAAEEEERERERAEVEARRKANQREAGERKQKKDERDRRMVLGMALESLLLTWLREAKEGNEIAQRSHDYIMQRIEPRVRDKRGRALLGLEPLPDDTASRPFTT
jgi:hypothetical protein